VGLQAAGQLVRQRRQVRRPDHREVVSGDILDLDLRRQRLPDDARIAKVGELQETTSR
jgi:hypothetical protein